MSYTPIHIKPSHRGLLHRKLGVAAGKKIPMTKLEAARHSANAQTRKEAIFAINATHFNHQ